jgi:predicted amidohydrolase
MIKSQRIGMGQMYVHPGEPEKNMRKAIDMIEQAAKRGCSVIVLPECLDLGWTYPEAFSLAQAIPGPHTDALSLAAADHAIYVAAGLTEKNGNTLHNAAVLISPRGEILLKHRKINELSIATHLYTTGVSLGVACTDIGKIGLNICADNSPEAIVLGQAQALMGANILLSPSAWAVEPDHDNRLNPYGGLWIDSYTRLAKQNKMPVIGVSYVGPVHGGAWDGWKCIGCSLAVDANGDVIIQGSYGEHAEELLVVNLKY